MGQTVNPHIFRLGKTKNWPSKYLAKKASETSIYAFKDLEIRKFADKFFKDNGLTVSNCKINYSDDGSLHIFISYYLTLRSLSLINNLTNEQKISLIKVRNRKSGKIKKKQKQIRTNIRNCIKYQNITHHELVKNLVAKKNHKKAINNILRKRQTFNTRRIRLLKFYKTFLTIKKFPQFDSIQNNSFTTNFFNSLHFFLKKNIKIFLTLQQLNNNSYQEATKNKVKFFKKSLIKLRKYKQNEFFKEGVHIFFMSTTQNQMANFISQFISTHLSKSKKKRNFFLKFVKAALTLFESNPFSNIKGIKIKINGRINGRPRARHKIMTIGKGVPAITINSNINYAESTAYTSNGTLGVKVWICNNI
jgi:ribosomal protein S3